MQCLFLASTDRTKIRNLNTFNPHTLAEQRHANGEVYAKFLYDFLPYVYNEGANAFKNKCLTWTEHTVYEQVVDPSDEALLLIMFRNY